MGESNNLALALVVYDKPPYDPLKELTPVMIVMRVPIVLLTHPSLPVSNLRELVAYAKQRPGKLSWGSSSAGGLGHLTHALLTQSAGVDILHVPYKGAAAAMLAVMSGEAQMSSGAASTAMAQIKAGKVKALAVTSAKRSPVLPDVPTAAESGLPGLEAIVWFALDAELSGGKATAITAWPPRVRVAPGHAIVVSSNIPEIHSIRGLGAAFSGTKTLP